jgi:hypothetical protein
MAANTKRIEQAVAAREWRDTVGAKFMRATFDAPIMQFINCTAPAAYLRGANGGGKSYAAAWVITSHALGRYPADYVGWKPKPMADAYSVKMIVMSQSSQVLRDVMQQHLLGDYAGGNAGNGMIPKANIVKIEAARGVAGSADYAIIRRDDGTLCQIFFRSYEAGRVAVQGIRANGGIFCDELFNDDDLLGELLGRFAGVGGIFRVTATERYQSSAVANWFYEDPSNRPIFQFSLDDITRIPDAEKKAFLANLPEAERATRYYGAQFTGGGMVWHTPLNDILCDIGPGIHDVDTRYLISLDYNHFGQSQQSSQFAALFWAFPSRAAAGTAYIFDEILMRGSIGDQAAAMLDHGARGIPIAWPHDGQQGQADGSSIVKMFKAFDGLRFHHTWATMNADPKAGYNRESGIELANNMLSTGKIKAARSLINFRQQYVRYERDDRGIPVPKNDDLMSSFRIGAMMTKIARPIESAWPGRAGGIGGSGSGMATLNPDAGERYFGIDL